MTEGLQLDEVGMEDNEVGVDDTERVIRVGDLVEFWAGPVVRGYRTDGGDPGFVKEIHGLGYGIKMVGSFGGETDECSGRVCSKMVHFKSKLGKVAGLE